MYLLRPVWISPRVNFSFIYVSLQAGDEAIPVMSEARQVEHRFIQDGFAKGSIYIYVEY